MTRREAALPPDPHGPAHYYECSYCREGYDEWIEDCPACGQLVVRIVEPPG